jgi:hypothetical protein
LDNNNVEPTKKGTSSIAFFKKGRREGGREGGKTTENNPV